jgi:hypothetical protein
VVVRRDVIFEEDRDFQISLELRVNVEDDAKALIDVLEGAQPQVSLYTNIKGDRVTVYSFRVTVRGCSVRGGRGFLFSEC